MWNGGAIALGIAFGLAGIAIIAYAAFLAARYFFVPRDPDQIHFALTKDGWRVAVFRYKPATGTVARPEPLLLVHGIAANRYNLDLCDERSMAKSLAAEGWDVWLVELRGRGLSSRPRLFSRLRYDWTFDEYAEKDLPAAAQTVLDATGAKRLFLVGFSTGALACYAFLSDARRNVEIAGLVSLAGPSSFKRVSRAVSGQLIRSLRWMRHRWLMRVLAPVSGYVHPGWLEILYNPENTDGKIMRRAMVNMIANFSRNELLQYSDWILHDVFRSIDRRRDYRAELPSITTPMLLLSGPRDALAPPDGVKATFEAIGSVDKEWRVLSRAQGMKVNYGHFDLIIGREAPGEIYPLVHGWLAQRSQLLELSGAATVPVAAST